MSTSAEEMKEALKDLAPEEVAEYLEMLGRGELNDPVDEPVYRLTMKGWGVWTVLSEYELENLLRKLLPIVLATEWRPNHVARMAE